MITEKVTVNDEAVWYRNKWKNLLLKIKYLFVKSPFDYNKFKKKNYGKYSSK